MSVVTVRDSKRGCGWRSPGGLYLMAPGRGENCDRLPIVLDVCPTCSAGIKPTRGFTWIDGEKMAAPLSEHGDLLHRDNCPLQPYAMVEYATEVKVGIEVVVGHGSRHAVAKAGLVWVGEAFYKTPEEFSLEAARLGISRRIPAVPRDFAIGRTWVFLAHRKVPTQSYVCKPCAERQDLPLNAGRVEATCASCERAIDGDVGHRVAAAAVFHLFRPTRIEYVTRGDETPEEIERMEKRGITPVKVERVEEPGPAQEALL